ncbi:RDD family protein [Paenibacillus alginolyticus]|uniref:RDD family protein n=1 Tax=Paenibacillus alginolyticus TaxID=59839 RepID=A0ABT4G5R8_9BACL|nr:RDD family protein [Paenibacillus alginolyticus]MCY9669954.1 RDD family protein [Paenibacillus alginolyticus]MCY9691509.1 RDD family protein [Paenibacillus alginolyticus]MEC0148790.1 RDD family protein [Paenibacillus alginolyticus]
MNESLDKELTIVTPEQVQLQFQTAGIGSRTLAHLIDCLILLVMNGLLFVFAILISRLYSGDWLPALADYLIAIALILWVVVNLGYFVCTEAFMGGQTPGKRILGLRVLQNNGQSATLLSILIRNLFRLLDMMPTFYFIGAVSIIFSAKDKRIGDMVAGTIVVIEARFERMKRRKHIDKAISKKNYPILTLEIEEAKRQEITAVDWQLLQAWVERIPTMHDAKLQELALPIAQHFAKKLGHDLGFTLDPAAYLAQLYEKLRNDWEV